jgi:hypothetical protein
MRCPGSGLGGFGFLTNGFGRGAERLAVGFSFLGMGGIRWPTEKPVPPDLGGTVGRRVSPAGEGLDGVPLAKTSSSAEIFVSVRRTEGWIRRKPLVRRAIAPAISTSLTGSDGASCVRTVWASAGLCRISFKNRVIRS